VRGLVASLVRSSDYSARDVLRTLRGVRSTQTALLPELASMNLARTLPRIDVPVVMAQGRLDQVAPGEAAQQYFDSLIAPGKQLVWFEASAHTPQLEEPQKYRALLMTARIRRHASTRPGTSLATPSRQEQS
jgi:pimeloyl-ACP methyl ester carboxylesterase